MGEDGSMAQRRRHSRPAATIARKIRRLLIDGEVVIAVAANNRLGRRLILPASGVVVTTNRILFVQRGIFSMRFQDLHREHVQDVLYAKSLFGSTLGVVGAATKTPSATIAATGAQRQLAMDYLHRPPIGEGPPTSGKARTDTELASRHLAVGRSAEALRGGAIGALAGVRKPNSQRSFSSQRREKPVSKHLV